MIAPLPVAQADHAQFLTLEPVFPGPLVSGGAGCPQTCGEGELEEQKASQFLAPRSSDDFPFGSPPLAKSPALPRPGGFEWVLTPLVLRPS